MEDRTFETVTRILSEKIELLEWQLKVEKERTEELKCENEMLKNRLVDVQARKENTNA